MTKNLIFIAVMVAIFFLQNVAYAAPLGKGKKILYIPIDNRPCNLKQTAEVAEKLGYEILSPPEEFLGTGATFEKFGQPEELWQWLNDNAAGVQAAVISTDAMLYGSLVGSRQHDLTAEEVLRRAEKFADFKKNFPYLPIYAFATIMRTPTVLGSSSEPEYYKQYGKAIYDYAWLKDKQEIEELSRNERKEFARLKNHIPQEVSADWFARRDKNFNANKYFVDLMESGVFEYLLIGCDDNAKFSQTHLESRHLSDYGKELPVTQFQVMSGADELGILMISRAINKDLNEIPFVAAEYNEGKGSETIPRLSNEKISDSIYGAIFAAGGLPIPASERADFVVAVNTNFDGKTFNSDSAKNKISPRRGTRTFMKILTNLLEKNYPVGIADISTSNGADNALMEQLRENDLQFKLHAYGGWNTATNSSGFLIGAGVLTKFMTEYEKNSLLLTRYLDDWAYQSNVRTQINNGLVWTIPGEGNLYNLNERRDGLEKLTANLLTDFAKDNFKLPANSALKNISAKFTWDRTFESDISFDFDK